MLTQIGPTINGDGSGRLYDEIQYELHYRGVYNIGLIGYSHGGGMIAKLAVDLWDDPNTPLFPPPGASVVFSATIDAVQYGWGPMAGLGTWLNPLQGTNPLDVPPARLAAKFGIGWNGTAVNYWEPGGYKGWTGRRLGDIRGMAMAQYGATDHELPTDTHSTIATDDWVLSHVETDTANLFGSLSW